MTSVSVTSGSAARTSGSMRSSSATRMATDSRASPVFFL
jgi:hypothetical protein